MGRPIKKIFIGERSGVGAGGEGLASVTVVTGTSSGFVNDEAALITAPDLEGGVQAEGTVVSGGGALDDVTVTVQGSGYTSPPTITFTTGTIGTGTATGVLTTGGNPVILATAFIPVGDGGSANVNADIEAQKGKTIFRVTTSEGTGECNLVDPATGLAHGTPNAGGEMQIIATDSGGATYSVTQLYNNHVILENIGGSPEFADGVKVKWAHNGVAVVNDSVQITA